jgi:hypothetical protein
MLQTPNEPSFDPVKKYSSFISERQSIESLLCYIYKDLIVLDNKKRDEYFKKILITNELH